MSPAERRGDARRSSCTRTCPTSRASAPGRSARSGCGRRSPTSTCRCSTLLEATARRVTLGADAGALRPARGAPGAAGERLLGVPARRARSESTARTSTGSPTPASRAWRPSCAARPATTRAPPSAFEALRRRPARRVRGRRDGRRAVDVGGDPRGAAAAGDRRRRSACRSRPASPATAARFGALGRRLLAARVRLRARARAGSSRDAGVRAVCVDLTDVLGHGALAQLEPIATAAGPDRGADRPGDRRAGLERRSGYPADRRLPRLPPPHASTTCGRGATTAAPTTPAAARRRGARARARLRRRAIARLDGYAERSGRPGTLCCALDTELLGHWWYEGLDWLRPCVDEAARAGPRRWRPLADGARRASSPVERDARAPRPGGRRGPLDLGLAARSPRSRSRPARAELRTVAAAARGARGPAPSGRRASCWRCRRATGRSMVTRELAADYPGERVAERHRRALDAALAALADSAAGRSRRSATSRPIWHWRRSQRPDPMRVLILSWEYPPLVEGGLARHVRKLAEKLVAQGVEVHVLTRGDERHARPRRSCDGVHRPPRARAARARATSASSSPGSST